MKRPRFLWGLLALVAASAGCNIILGNKSFDLAEDVDPTSPDATAPSDAGANEGGSPDAVPDQAVSATIPVAEGGDEGADGGSGEGGCNLTDIHSCGSCTNDCTQYPHVSTTGLACNGSVCTYACESGFSDCADAGTGCGTELSSSSSCGGCGTACGTAAPLCAPSDAGVYACANGCGAGQTNCSSTCANLMTDATHCGTCSTACPASQSCMAGVCQCKTTADPDLCGAACTNKQTDSANCGSCGHMCSGGETCQAGVCACASNQKLCNGTCVNVLGTDVANCGACGTSCAQLPHVAAAGLACTAGKCSYSCAAGFADCGSTGTGCNTALGSATNCSGCGAGCSGATPVCSASGATYACTNGCTAGETNCSGTCTTLQGDSSHCGNCTTVCAASEACQSGTCVCPTTANPNFCGSACTNTQTDTANCGTCTHACPSAETCKSGVCSCPTTANPNFCGSACTNTQSDASNCGSCTHACPTGETCQAGTCACPTTANPNYCGSACTNVQTDSNNCGTCTSACGGGEQCTSGKCQCPSGTILCGTTCQKPNLCGGCGTFTGTPGGACGTCGTYACNAGNTGLTCNDPGTTNSCPTWCSSQPAPSGVAAADYQCLDFDKGLPSANVWAQVLAGSGTLSATTTRFNSSPNSMVTMVTANGADQAALKWSNTGATAISNVSVSMEIQPITPAEILPSSSDELDLITLDATSVKIFLYYVENSDLQSGYNGLGLRWEIIGSAATSENCVLGASPNVNQWNSMQLNVAVGAPITIGLNGTNLTCSCCPSSFGLAGSDSVNVTVGAATFGLFQASYFPWQTYFDNVQVAIKR